MLALFPAGIWLEEPFLSIGPFPKPAQYRSRPFLKGLNRSMTIQWYPGHMHKARRMIEAELKLVDGVVEVVDARLPLSSRNPDLQDLTDKPRFLVLAKADLADPAVTEQWVKYWASQGISAIPANLVSG